MKIVIAPASFKGSLLPLEAARAIELGVRSALPPAETVLAPVADGGDGTLEAILYAQGGNPQEATVTGPLGFPIKASWAVLLNGDTAVIEMAAASGLALLPPGRRDPMHATTYGVGELIRVALDQGCRRIIVGLGGSATVDGGAGMAQALGVGLYDRSGRPLPPGGAALASLARVDLSGLDQRMSECQVAAAYDVANPLLGPDGAARVYGPQKGATAAMVAQLEEGLSRLAEVVKRDLGLNVADLPGAGAAGGLGAGLAAFLGARLISGVEFVLDAVGLRAKLAGAHLAFTGEGTLDYQTAYGKAPAGVARMARELRIPVVALAGSLGRDYQTLYQEGVDAVMSIVPGPMSWEQAMGQAYGLLAQATELAVRMMAVGGRWASQPRGGP